MEVNCITGNKISNSISELIDVVIGYRSFQHLLLFDGVSLLPVDYDVQEAHWLA